MWNWECPIVHGDVAKLANAGHWKCPVPPGHLWVRVPPSPPVNSGRWDSSPYQLTEASHVPELYRTLDCTATCSQHVWLRFPTSLPLDETHGCGAVVS